MAKPGTTSGGAYANGTSPRFSPDPGSTGLPPDELALLPVTADADGNALAPLRFTPPAPGTYPVFMGGYYYDCVATTPDPKSKGMFIGQIGAIDAR